MTLLCIHRNLTLCLKLSPSPMKGNCLRSVRHNFSCIGGFGSSPIWPERFSVDEDLRQIHPVLRTNRRSSLLQHHCMPLVGWHIVHLGF
ncbi:hypothetical protein U1Q18_036333 [Sarracenia purpurea var. burkii]